MRLVVLLLLVAGLVLPSSAAGADVPGLVKQEAAPCDPELESCGEPCAPDVDDACAPECDTAGCPEETDGEGEGEEDERDEDGAPPPPRDPPSDPPAPRAAPARPAAVTAAPAAGTAAPAALPATGVDAWLIAGFGVLAVAAGAWLRAAAADPR